MDVTEVREAAGHEDALLQADRAVFTARVDPQTAARAAAACNSRSILRSSTTSTRRRARGSSMRPLRLWLPLSLAALALTAPAAATPLPRLAGETVITALAEAPGPSFLERVRSGEVGGVILVGHWSSSAQMAAVTRTLQAAACEHGTPLLLAVDQEGGPMRRMPWAAPAESARSLGDRGEAQVQREGRAAAAALRRAGIAIDFAPVADTRLSPASFLGTRAFSDDPAIVGRPRPPSSAGSRRAASPRPRSTSPASAPHARTRTTTP